MLSMTRKSDKISMSQKLCQFLYRHPFTWRRRGNLQSTEKLWTLCFNSFQSSHLRREMKVRTKCWSRSISRAMTCRLCNNIWATDISGTRFCTHYFSSWDSLRLLSYTSINKCLTFRRISQKTLWKKSRRGLTNYFNKNMPIRSSKMNLSQKTNWCSFASTKLSSNPTNRVKWRQKFPSSCKCLTDPS